MYMYALMLKGGRSAMSIADLIVCFTLEVITRKISPMVMWIL